MDNFFRLQIHVHERVGISQAEVYDRVGKSTIERKLLEILFRMFSESHLTAILFYLVLHENDK